MAGKDLHNVMQRQDRKYYLHLKTLMLKAGIETQTMLAERCGISKGQISEWFNSFPYIAEASKEKIAEALGVSVKDLYPDDGNG
jgi:transcriptional regulator with XRE-family HTH domain